MKTEFSKSIRGGYMAESYTETDTNGKAWQITTMKRSNGQVSCSAIQGDISPAGVFSYMMFGAKRLQLANEKTNGTEAAIRRVHAAGLIEFERIQKEETPTAPVYVVEVGQVIFTHGYDNELKRAVYEIESPGHYKAVTLDGQQLCMDSHVDNYKNKFGIGVYYNEGEKISLEEVNNLVNQARQATEERNQKEAEARTAAAQEKARKIEAGRAIVPAIPEGVKAVIVAELHKNESDPMTDYYSHTTEQVVYLAWSTHTRDLFPEMRKAAEKFEGTKHLGAGKGVFKTYELEDGRYSEHGPDFTTEAEARDYVASKGGKWEYREQEIEHREKYSMGSGYYLKDGHSNSTGWAVSKSNLGGYGATLEALQIAAAEGRFFCGQEAESITEPTAAPAGTIQIIEHPKRAGKILVIGETYAIRATLKSLGGWWNKWEKGWEFKSADLDTIAEALSKSKSHEPPAPEDVPEEPSPEEAQQIEEAPTPAEIVTQDSTARALQLAQEAGERAAKHSPSAAAEAMEKAAARLIEMAAAHRAKMATVRQEIAEEVQKVKEIGTSADGFFRVSGPEPRKDTKSGRTNTALPAPQMFISY